MVDCVIVQWMDADGKVAVKAFDDASLARSWKNSVLAKELRYSARSWNLCESTFRRDWGNLNRPEE